MTIPGEKLKYYRYQEKKHFEEEGHIVVEKKVSLYVNGEDWLTFLCTPAHLDALGVGFLFTEGLIESYQEIRSISICQNSEMIDVWTSHKIKKPVSWQKTSGCSGGMTSSKGEFLEIRISDNSVVSPEDIFSCMEQLVRGQKIYQEMGGVHSSGLFSKEAVLLNQVEDIGRHNTIDKLAGLWLMDPSESEHLILATTGRVSSEMIRKAYRIGASIVLSRSSPTSMAIEIARQARITLIGYLRSNSFNIYTHQQRIDVSKT